MDIQNEQRIIIYIPDIQRQQPKPTGDEMRFTAVRKQAPIPSRAFQNLQKMTGEQDGGSQPYEQHHPQDGEENVQGSGEVDPRYRGPKIPSRSFKMLQEMTGSNNEGVSQVVPPMNRPQRHQATRVAIPVQENPYPEDQEQYYYQNPSVPASQQPMEAEPKKYMGGHIPSRSFRMLQAMTGGDDESFEPEPCEAPVEQPAPQQGEVKMYTGGHIPSRSFRYLQHMTGEDGRANGENGVTDF